MSRAGRVFALLVLLAPALPAQDPTPAQLVDRFLAAKDYQKRRDLQNALVELGLGGARATRQALNQERPLAERRRLVSLLALIPAPGVAAELKSLVLTEKDTSMRASAILGMASHGDEGFSALATLLHADLIAYDRTRVCETLVKIGRPQVTALLVGALRKDLKEEGATDLIRVLVHHDADTAVRLFPKLLGQASEVNQARMVIHLANLLPYVPESRRKPVANALKSARKRLMRELTTAQGLELRDSARALGVLGDAAAARTLREAQENKPNEAFLWALARIDPEGSRDLFLAALAQEKEAGRYTLSPTALRGLARTDDPALTPVFLEWLTSGETKPAEAAVEGLVRIGDHELAPKLAEALLRGAPEPALKLSLLKALLALPHPDVVYPLARAVGEESGTNRTLALRALCAIEGPAATAELIRLAGDKKVQGVDRGWLLASLAVRTGKAIPAILATGHTSTRLREAMTRPEARVHLQGLIDLLTPDPDTGLKAATLTTVADLLGALGDPAATDALEQHLGSKDRKVFLAVMAAWASCGPEGQVPDQGLAALHVPRLESLIAGSGMATLTRQNALRVLARLDPDSARSQVHRILASQADHLLTTALELLAPLGVTAQDRPALMALLGEGPDLPDTRVLDALCTLEDPEVDDAVLEHLDACGAMGRLAAEVYSLRCGDSNSTKKLAAALSDSYALFRDPDHTSHWQAHLVGGWLTGATPEKGTCTHPGVPSSYYEIKGLELALPFLPPNWRLETWVAEHQDLLLDDATFAAAVRSPRAGALLKAYLRKYPQGRHGADATRRLAALEG